jgi:hypothetical protein
MRNQREPFIDGDSVVIIDPKSNTTQKMIAKVAEDGSFTLKPHGWGMGQCTNPVCKEANDGR